MSREQLNQQIYLGYFATLMLALIAAVSAASYLAPMVSGQVPALNSPKLPDQITAVLFYALCAANPVGTWLRAGPMLALAIRTVIGGGAGLLLYTIILEPVAGAGLMRFSLLFSGALGLPIMMALDAWSFYRPGFKAPKLAPGSKASLTRLMSLPDGVYLIGLSACSFGFVVLIAKTPLIATVVLALLLAVVTALASYPAGKSDRALETNEDPDGFVWIEAEDEEDHATQNPTEDRVARVVFSVAPGALFIGAVLGFAVSMLPFLQPELGRTLVDYDVSFDPSLALGALGVAVVLGALVLSAIVSVLILKLMGHYGQWQAERSRSAFDRLLRALSLRIKNED